MKRTSLYEQHLAAGATIVPFAGWEMPVSYTGSVNEITAVRNEAGLFDVSHMGEVRISGPNAAATVQRLTANDVSKLSPGKAQYSLLLNEQGGVIDDIIVYCVGVTEFFIVLNAGCKEKDWAWIEEQARRFDPAIQVIDESDQTALIAAQGPSAVTKLTQIVNDPALAALPRFHFLPKEVFGLSLIFSRTGYTGEDGFEIFCAWDAAPKLWEILVSEGFIPAGLGARDVLRLEATYPLYGHELDSKTSPLESGVGWAVTMKPRGYIGQDAVRQKKEHSPARKLAGLRMEERAIPREHYTVYQSDGETVAGVVTSGTFSPTVKAGIALARLESGSAEIGTRVIVDIRGRKSAAAVVALPFYRNGV